MKNNILQLTANENVEVSGGLFNCPDYQHRSSNLAEGCPSCGRFFRPYSEAVASNRLPRHIRRIDRVTVNIRRYRARSRSWLKVKTSADRAEMQKRIENWWHVFPGRLNPRILRSLVVIKRARTLSLPLLLTCIVSVACTSSVPTSSGLSAPYRRHTRNASTPLIFDGRVVGVEDGDTITVLDSSNQNHRIRLQGIDAPERGQAFSTKSGQNLSQAVFDKVVTIEWSKRDRYRRIVGKVMLDGHDLCLQQIGAGMAWHYKYYQDEQTPEDRKLYSDAEDAARSARAGLWVDQNPIPPWDFRRQR
jgi:endonuclease YncB( thermonuclease family)